jgi:hypothetical protein
VLAFVVAVQTILHFNGDFPHLSCARHDYALFPPGNAGALDR